jgi:hypothetical protein
MSGVARFGLGLVATVLISGSAAACSAAPQGNAQANQSPSSAGLPPCPSVSATGCDHSKVPPSSVLPPCQSASATGCDKSKLFTCQGKGTRNLTASPIALADILFIQPMGLMIGAHVTPIDHGYFYIKGAMANPPRQAAVFAPLDGNISVVTRSVRNGATGTYDDYALSIDATCTFRVRFSNLVRFAGGLGDKVGQLNANESQHPNYAVKAGELIGYTGLPTAYGIDVWVENDDLTLTGFINPAQYTAGEVWKTHMADLFDYTTEPLKSQLLALDERDALPRWGKIGYDIDGRLVGTWFLAGSGGYSGVSHMQEGYWVGHLAVVYDGNDPRQVDISFGNYQGTPQQFAVVGNTPDPATVDQSTGLVRYELGQIEHYSADTGLAGDNISFLPHIRTRAGTGVMGTVLMQLVDTRSLKVEIFPGKPAGAVTGFDSGALMYGR